MGKDIHNSAGNNYVSKQILGQLFELVCGHLYCSESRDGWAEGGHADIQIHPDPEFKPVDIRLVTQSIVDPRLAAYKLPNSMIDEAYKLKEDYDVSVMGLMNR
jgi:hypothetical protein